MVTIFELLKTEQAETEVEKVEDIFGELAAHIRDVKQRNRFAAATSEVPEFAHPSLFRILPEDTLPERDPDSRSF